MKIYLDTFFLVNCLMNYLVISLHCLIRKRKVSTGRILLGAAVGALAAILVIVLRVKTMWLLVILCQVVNLMFLMWIIYGAMTIRMMALNLILYYVISFLVSGGILMIFELLPVRTIPYAAFLIIVVGMYHVVKYLLTWFTNYRIKMSHCFATQLHYRNQCITTTGYLDTGNQLREPISGERVSVVDFEFVKPLFAEEELRCIVNYLNLLQEQQPNELHLRLIPYHSIGKKNGYLVAFQADCIELYIENEWKMITNPWIGISEIRISGCGDYQLLLHDMDLEKCESI